QKKTDFEIIKLIRRLIERLYQRMGSCHLFSEAPRLNFYPADKRCGCGRETTVLKTSVKTIATRDVGEFRAAETQTSCKHMSQLLSNRVLLSPYVRSE
ncbi:MAG: hypothetical protein U9P00_05645, partial [Pseudomonadota bacterium]|nr:hypothetical protein [Pseudomonadota bacterium]